MNLTHVRSASMMLTYSYINGFVIIKISDNQRELVQENMQDEARFPKQILLGDFWSVVLGEDGHYHDGRLPLSC